MKKSTKEWLIVSALGVALVAASSGAMAGTGGAEFADILDMMSGWAKGTLGKVIAMGIFLVGIAGGIVKQSVSSAVTGVGGALVLNFGPAVIDNIFTALV